MKKINISGDELIAGFRDTDYIFSNSDLHEQLRKAELRADGKGAIEAMLDGKRYWITTEPSVFRLNDAGDYQIMLVYSVHEGSKYAEQIYGFKR